MPFARPTYSSLFDQAIDDIVTYLTGSSLLPQSILRIVARVQAKFTHGHYGYLDKIALNAVPFTATDEYLDAWAGLKGVTRKAATFASGLVQFSGTPGYPLPVGTPVSCASGIAYVTTTAGTVGSTGTVVVTVTATTAGTAGNAAVGVAMTLGSGVSGINSIGAVVAPSTTSTAGLTGGADQETDSALRTRMLAAYAAPPQGGDASDYVEWAEAVPGVTRAWCSPNQFGAGTVAVYFMMDDAEAASGGFPQGSNGVAASETRATAATGDQLTVANALYPLRPTTALVYGCAPAQYAQSFVINDLVGSTTTMQAAIVAALQAVTVRSADALGGKIYPNEWEAAIQAVSGVTDFSLASPTAPVAAPVGSIITVLAINVTFGTSA